MGFLSSAAKKLLGEFSEIVGSKKPPEQVFPSPGGQVLNVPASPLAGEFKSIVDKHLAGQPGMMDPAQLTKPQIKPELVKLYAAMPKPAPAGAGQPQTIPSETADAIMQALKSGPAKPSGMEKAELAATAPAVKTPKLTQPPPLTSAEPWTFVSGQQGSNYGGVFNDPQGVPWYVKAPQSDVHVRNEALANALYRAAGVDVPDMTMTTLQGKPAVASRMLSKRHYAPLGQLAPAPASNAEKLVRSGFATDAWLGNWDVIGLTRDNIMSAPGKAFRIDMGGALRFRAQGNPKEFGPEVKEWDTLRNENVNPQSASVFQFMTIPEMKASIDKVLAVPKETIVKLATQYGMPELTPILIKRQEHLASIKEGLEPTKTTLPMGQLQRMKRAQTLGFHVDEKSSPIGGAWYHSTGKQFYEFDIGKTKTEPAVFLTKNPKIAQYYSGGQHTIPVWTRAQNPKVVDFKGGHYSSSEFKSIIDQARTEGHDAVLFKNVSDLGGKQDQLAILKENLLRSTSAVFDPAKKESAKLMAGVAGGAVLAGAAGLGATEAKAEPMDDDFQTINVEGYGPTRFPQSMTDDQIAAAIKAGITNGSLKAQEIPQDSPPAGQGSLMRPPPAAPPATPLAALQAQLRPYREPGLRDPGQAGKLVEDWERSLMAGRGLTGEEPGPAGGVLAAAKRFPGAVGEVFRENVAAGARATAKRAGEAIGGLETPAYERGGEAFDEFMKIVQSPKQAAARAFAGKKDPLLETAAGFVSPVMSLGGVMASGQLAKGAQAAAAARALRPGKAMLGEMADDLFRLRGSATADRAELQELTRGFIKAEPQYSQPGVQTEIYRALENNAPLPPDKQAVVDKFIQPMRDEAFELYVQAKANAGEHVDLSDLDPTYMHRQAKGHWAAYDEPGTSVLDPVTGMYQRQLGRSTASLQAPKYVSLVDPKTGRSMVVQDLGDDTFQMWYQGKVVKDPKTGADAVLPFKGEMKPGQTVNAANQQFEVKRSVTDEIERSTPTRYHRNAFVNTADNLVRLRAVVRNQNYLNELKKSPEASKWMTAKEAVAKKQGWVESKIPQLKGTWMDPKLAHTLNDFAGHVPQANYLDWLRRVNHATTTMIFWNPTPHVENVLTHWLVGRGFDWLTPYGYKSLALDGSKAIKEVITMGPKYRELLREGSGLIYGSVRNRDFYQTIGRKMGMEIERDPQRWGQIAKSLGLNRPLDLAGLLYEGSRRVLWASGDMMLMQRIMELQRKGMPVRKAIREAEKHIPNYRIPIEVLGSRGLSEFMQDPAFTMFNRYHYGMLNSYAHMVNDLVRGKTGKERLDAIGNLMALGVLTYAVYPALDTAIRKLTGDPETSKLRRGPSAVPSELTKAWQGESEGFQKVLNNLMIWSPVTRTGMEQVTNRDFAGRPIREPGSPMREQVGQTLEHAGQGLVSPYSLFSQATREGGVGLGIFRNQLLGIRQPSEGAQRYETRKGKYQHRGAARRERRPRGPIEQFFSE